MPQFISTSQQFQQTPSCQSNPASSFQSFKPANHFNPVKKPSLVPCWLLREIHTPQPGTNPSTYNQSPNCFYSLIPCYSGILWPQWKQTSFAHLYTLICLSDFCHFLGSSQMPSLPWSVTGQGPFFPSGSTVDCWVNKSEFISLCLGVYFCTCLYWKLP